MTQFLGRSVASEQDAATPSKVAMKSHRVYQYLSAASVAVKVGFDWPSFFLTWMWAMWKRCWSAFWLHLGTQVAFTVLCGVVQNIGPAETAFVALSHLALCIWYATFMNQWRSTSLEKRGYRLIKEVLAYSPSDALARIVEEGAIVGDARTAGQPEPALAK